MATVMPAAVAARGIRDAARDVSLWLDPLYEDSLQRRHGSRGTVPALASAMSALADAMDRLLVGDVSHADITDEVASTLSELSRTARPYRRSPLTPVARS